MIASSINLTLTGETTGAGRFIVKIGEAAIALPESRFLALLVMAVARRHRPYGRADLTEFAASRVVYTKVDLHQLICRLRSDFDDVLGECSGKQLIVHKGRSRYALAVDPNEIKAEPNFRELESDIPAPLFQRLEELIPEPMPDITNAVSALSENLS